MMHRKYPLPVRQYANNHYNDTPGNRLRKARIAKNITIAELAHVINMTVTNLNYIENDKVKASLPTLRILSCNLNTEISYLGCFERMPEETLGQRITKARHYAGLTKKELAERLGVDVKTISNWEKDYCKPANPIPDL